MMATNMTHRALLGSLLLAALALTTTAHAQYMWIDEKGLKQLSDQPPPPSVPANRILKQPRQPGAVQGYALPGADGAAQSTPAPDATAPKAKREPTLAERNAEFAKRRAENQATEQKAAQEAARNSSIAANCESARSNQAGLDSGQRMSQFDKNGQRVFLSDEQRAERAKNNQKILADCPH